MKDIIIIGGGMIGLACAISMRRIGLSVLVIEKTEHINVDINDKYDRVSAISLSSVKLLQSYGVWEDILKHKTCPYTKMQVSDASGTGSLEFNASESEYETLGYICENNNIRNNLYIKALEHGVEFIFSVNIEKLTKRDFWKIVTDTGEFNARLLIAADGATSRVRELLNIRTMEWNYLNECIVGTIETGLPHNFTTFQVFRDDCVVGFLPLVNTNTTTDNPKTKYNIGSFAWYAPSHLAAKIMHMDADIFCKELAKNYEFKLGNISHVYGKTLFKLRQRHVVNFSAQQLVLLGDAAHTVSSLAGQGVNMGFLDVHALEMVITNSLKHKNTDFFAYKNLRLVHEARILHQLALTTSMDIIEKTFNTDNMYIRLLRNNMLNTINDCNILKNIFIKEAQGFGVLPRGLGKYII